MFVARCGKPVCLSRGAASIWEALRCNKEIGGLQWLNNVLRCTRSFHGCRMSLSGSVIRTQPAIVSSSRRGARSLSRNFPENI